MAPNDWMGLRAGGEVLVRLIRGDSANPENGFLTEGQNARDSQEAPCRMFDGAQNMPTP
jgi:hypothetical protein